MPLAFLSDGPRFDLFVLPIVLIVVAIFAWPMIVRHFPLDGD